MWIVRISCFCLLFTLTPCFKFFEHGDKTEENPTLFSSLLDKKVPKIINVYSKPPEHKVEPKPQPEHGQEKGFSFFGNVGNVLHGGTIGIEGKPFGHVRGMIDHAKRIIPSITGIFKKPHKQPPRRGDHDYDEKDFETKHPYEPKEPPKTQKKPKPSKEWDDVDTKPDGPSWEDIGEDESYSHLIDPRKRPKRFIESKIYHVPLLFRSNAKPYRVKIRNKNTI